MIIDFINNNLQILIQIIGFGSVLLLAYQIYSTNKWNRDIQSLDKLSHSFIINNMQQLNDAGFKIIKGIPMTDEDLIKLLNINNHNLKKLADDVLHELEKFSIQYNMNMFNKHYVFHAYSDNIIDFYEYLKPLIEHYCIKDENYYSELKKCYKSILKKEKIEKLKTNFTGIFRK
jgi:hypothetical protein